MTESQAAVQAHAVRRSVPAEGLFAGVDWRVAPAPFILSSDLSRELHELGRVLAQFNRAVNLLYRRSVQAQEPVWIHRWLDQGKPDRLLALQRDPALKNALPRVIRPDLLLTESGLALVELDSVPGGMGLTAWLNQVYSGLPDSREDRGPDGGTPPSQAAGSNILGGAEGMLEGFAGIFGGAPRVHIVVSEEAAMYRPEMQWLARTLNDDRFRVRDTRFEAWQSGDAVYRFFELFDWPNVANADRIFQAAREQRIVLTPPPKPIFEEKLLFALLWNRNLHGFWRRELGERFFTWLKELVPQTWVVDPTPLPPQAAIPGLEATDWSQLKSWSQRQREFILKISGYSELAWGSRGVVLGSDLSQAEWSAAIDHALASFPHSPYVLQRYHKPKTVIGHWYDFGSGRVQSTASRVRLCPYYFLAGEGDAARANLGGVLATLCPRNKKIIHGMSEAILAPCAV
jgi:hypothetical protein